MLHSRQSALMASQLAAKQMADRAGNNGPVMTNQNSSKGFVSNQSNSSVGVEPTPALTSSPSLPNAAFAGSHHGIEEPPHYTDLPLASLVPLLGTALSCRFRDTTVTAIMKSSIRRRVLESMILKLLLMHFEDGGAEKHCCILLADNVQWMDGYSMRVLLRFLRLMTSGVFIGTMRQYTPLPAESTNTTEVPKKRNIIGYMGKLCVHMKLKPLGAADVKLIMERCVGSTLLLAHPEIIAPGNVSQLLERSGGSPFHAMVMAQGLRKALISGRFTCKSRCLCVGH